MKQYKTSNSKVMRYFPNQSQEYVLKLSQESIAKCCQLSDYILTGESVSSLSLTENSVPTGSELFDYEISIQQINRILSSLNLPP